MSSPDKNDEAFETFRKYWNSCEEMKLAPEYGRIFAIFKSAARSAIVPPLEPTEDMIRSGVQAWLNLYPRTPSDDCRNVYINIWKAMYQRGVRSDGSIAK